MKSEPHWAWLMIWLLKKSKFWYIWITKQEKNSVVYLDPRVLQNVFLSLWCAFQWSWRYLALWSKVRTSALYVKSRGANSKALMPRSFHVNKLWIILPRRPLILTTTWTVLGTGKDPRHPCQQTANGKWIWSIRSSSPLIVSSSLNHIWGSP